MRKIINQVQSNWNKDLIIRFLYIKLAPYVHWDLLYFLASEEEKERQYKQGFNNRFPHIVCSTLADFYVDIFKQFGINAKKVVANSAKIPLFSVLVEGIYGWYFLDPINDLFSNQYGLRPYFFGVIPPYKTILNTHPEMIKLPHEYINDLDITLDIKFLDEFFFSLHLVFTNRRDANEFFGLPREAKIDLKERKLHYYNEELINLGNVHAPFERAQLYKYLNDRLLNKGEKRFTKVRLTGGLENAYISIELINRDGSILYEEDNQNQKYVLIKKL